MDCQRMFKPRLSLQPRSFIQRPHQIHKNSRPCPRLPPLQVAPTTDGQRHQLRKRSERHASLTEVSEGHFSPRRLQRSHLQDSTWHRFSKVFRHTPGTDRLLEQIKLLHSLDEESQRAPALTKATDYVEMSPSSCALLPKGIPWLLHSVPKSWPIHCSAGLQNNSAPAQPPGVPAIFRRGR